ncbi:hypothetical protein JZU46_02860 [bacterium]|nr:hypothetical protein [bacterium]
MIAWFKRFIFKIWLRIPLGNICTFWYNDQRITVTKDLWIIVDAGKGTVADALPVVCVSQRLVEMIEAVLRARGYIA